MTLREKLTAWNDRPAIARINFARMGLLFGLTLVRNLFCTHFVAKVNLLIDLQGSKPPLELWVDHTIHKWLRSWTIPIMAIHQHFGSDITKKQHLYHVCVLCVHLIAHMWSHANTRSAEIYAYDANTAQALVWCDVTTKVLVKMMYIGGSLSVNWQ